MKILLILSFLMVSTFSWAKLPSLEELIEESKSVNWDKAISRSLIIRAPVEVVWKYASDSTNAANWSVYFAHISPLPGKFPDGQVGSLRRCFRHADESGERWDEITIESVPNTRRIIVSYDFTNYPARFFYKNEYAFVRQLYRKIDDQTTEMTFQTIRRKGFNPVWMFVFQGSSKEMAEIFQLNLENIRAAIEGYPRVYPWR